MNKRLKTTINNWEKKLKNILDNASKGIATRGDDGTFMVSDIADYIAIINLLKNNNDTGAYRKLVFMDTDARDNVPLSIHKYLFSCDDVF